MSPDGSILIDKMIDTFKDKNVDYLSNILPPSYPDGLDIEIFSSKVLYDSYNSTNHSYDLEHVTPYIEIQISLLSIILLIKKIYLI